MLDLTSLKSDLGRLAACSFTTTVKEVRGPVVVTGRLPVPIGTVVRFSREPAEDLTPAHDLLGEVTGFSGQFAFVAPYLSQQRIAPDTPVS